MFTDQQLKDLISNPKVIVKRKPSKGYKLDGSHFRCDLDLQSVQNSEQTYTVFIRQNHKFTDNFSIGLRYLVNEENLNNLTLVRYNGPHGETSQAPDGHYAKPHIHHLTEKELAFGHTQPQEKSRETDPGYNTFEEALEVFFINTNTQNYRDYFPELMHRRLFNGH